MTASKDVKQLARSPYHMLKRAAQFAASIYANEVGKSGLTQRQFTVLAAADENDGISQTALVRLTGIDRSTLADLVARLMAQGYLQRRRTRDDGRTNSVKLTAQGKKILKMAVPGAEEVDKQLLACIPTVQRKGFLECVGMLAEAMDKQEQAGSESSTPKRGRRRT